MRSFLWTLAITVLILLITKATVHDEEERITVSPPVLVMVTGPPGISDATLKASFDQKIRIQFPKSVDSHPTAPSE